MQFPLGIGLWERVDRRVSLSRSAVSGLPTLLSVELSPEGYGKRELWAGIREVGAKTRKRKCPVPEDFSLCFLRPPGRSLGAEKFFLTSALRGVDAPADRLSPL